MSLNRFRSAFGLITSEDERADQVQRVSYLFTWLLIAQAIMAVCITLFVSFRADLNHNWFHSHILQGGLIGIATMCPAVALTRFAPTNVFARHVIANTLILQSLWLIIATGGRIEGHFSVFTVLAMIAFYLDWTLYVSVSVIGVGYHCILGHMNPMWVYGVPAATLWRCAEHGGWIIYEVIFLLAWVAIRLGAIKTIVGLRLQLVEKVEKSVAAFDKVKHLKDLAQEVSDESEMQRLHRELGFAEERVARHHEALNKLLIQALGNTIRHG